MKEVPKQYELVIESLSSSIITEAEKLWPFVQELGHSFECETKDIRVIIGENPPKVDLGRFETWLKSTCFQSPTKEAYELAKEAWLEAHNQ